MKLKFNIEITTVVWVAVLYGNQAGAGLKTYKYLAFCLQVQSQSVIICIIVTYFSRLLSAINVKPLYGLIAHIKTDEVCECC